MSLNRFEVFQTVVECGSLTKAGEILNTTQSGVSHAIASLESEFGFSLLIRGKAGVYLTDNGVDMLKYVREILAINEKMKQEAASIIGIETGVVKIGTFTSVASQWLPFIIKQFQEQHPGIETKIVEGDYSTLEQDILNGKIDCGFITLPVVKSLEVIHLKKDKMLCIVSDQHPFHQQDSILFSQLKSEALIMPKRNWANEIDRIFKENGIKPNVKYEVSDDQTILAMVQNNLGISIRPEMTLASLPENVRVLKLEKDSYRFIGIAAKPSMSPATRKFMEGTHSYLKSCNLLST